MQAEYQRDYNRNYLILHGDPEQDLSAYPVRMLLAGSVPCLLPCREQSFDGEPFFYYDITSRQAVSAYYEKKKLRKEDLEFLLPAVIRGIRQMSVFLMSADQLCLEPEYLYMDLEKSELYFCFLPGREKDIREQLRGLMEYLLPKIDHEDAHAVTIAYGVYRRTMDEDFLMDQIMEEIYLEAPVEKREKTGKKDVFRSGKREEGDLFAEWERESPGSREEREPVIRRGMIAGLLLCSLFLLSLSLARGMGYFTGIRIEWVIGGLLLSGGTAVSVSFLLEKNRKRRESPVLPIRKGTFPLSDETVQRGFSGERSFSGRFPGQGSEEKTVMLRRERREEASTEPEREKAGHTDGIVGITEDLVQISRRKYPVLKNREPGNLEDILLEEELTVIGKLPGASDVILPYATISRIHAKIQRKKETYYLSDLNSRNGTFLNGTALKGEEARELKDQDEIRFGGLSFLYTE